MKTNGILFFSPPPPEEGVRRIRPDGGAEDVLYALYENRDGGAEVSSGYWECFAGTITVESYPMDEICFITEGSAVIADGEGRERTVSPGDVLLIPKGAYSRWIIPERVKKVYFIAR